MRRIVMFTFDIVIFLVLVTVIGTVFTIYKNPELVAQVGCKIQADNAVEYHACVLMNTH